MVLYKVLAARKSSETRLILFIKVAVGRSLRIVVTGAPCMLLKEAYKGGHVMQKS